MCVGSYCSNCVCFIGHGLVTCFISQDHTLSSIDYSLRDPNHILNEQYLCLMECMLCCVHYSPYLIFRNNCSNFIEICKGFKKLMLSS
jgi:hypothetical protein